MSSNLTELYNTAMFIVSAALLNETVQAKAIQFFGKKLRGYIGGIDTFNETDQEARYPYLQVTPTNLETTNGHRVITVHAQLAIRADRWGDSTKPVYSDQNWNFPLQVGAYVEMFDLVQAVEDAIREENIGSVIDSIDYEFDLENQYPVQVADMTITVSDLEAF